MSRVDDPFDCLMDRLAALAVEAVQVPETAIQAYWLCLIAAMLQDEPSSLLPLAVVVQRAMLAGSLDDWARPLAPGALVQLLRAEDLLESMDGPHLPRRLPVTWEQVISLHKSTISVRQIYQPYIADMQAQASQLWQATRCLYGVRSEALQQLPEEMARGVVLFETGLYFACHEYFETLWGRTGDEASDFYQGLIQVAVAMRHLESHNVRGAVSLLHNGLRRLRQYPANYKGLTLTRFLAEVVSLLHYLHTLPHATQYQFDPAQVPRLLVNGT
jgi:predicted metal-dependent hydrolase